jgi:hypothetical protein
MNEVSIHLTLASVYGTRKGDRKATHEVIDRGGADSVDKLDDQLDHENDDQ